MQNNNNIYHSSLFSNENIHTSTHSIETTDNSNENNITMDVSTFTSENASFADRWYSTRNTHWKVITLNVRELNNDFKFFETIAWLKQYNIDIACLIETKFSSKSAK